MRSSGCFPAWNRTITTYRVFLEMLTLVTARFKIGHKLGLLEGKQVCKHAEKRFNQSFLPLEYNPLLTVAQTQNSFFIMQTRQA